MSRKAKLKHFAGKAMDAVMSVEGMVEPMVQKVVDEAKPVIHDMKEKAKPVVDEVKEKAKPVMDEVKEKAKPVVDEVKEKTKPVVDEVKEKSKPVVKTVKDKATAVKKSAKDIADKFVDRQVFLQYDGQEILMRYLVDKAEEDYAANGSKAGTVKVEKVYVKPEDHAAYYVINDSVSGKINF